MKFILTLLIGIIFSGCAVYSEPVYPEYRYDTYGQVHYYDSGYGIWIGPGHPYYNHYYYRYGHGSPRYYHRDYRHR